jgi:DHA2 family multidrug resistance protein
MSSQDTIQAEEFPPLQGAMLALAIFTLAAANFMAVLDTTIVNVAIPHIAGGLAISTTDGTWAITSYAVAEAITVPLSGWLAARFGAVRVFIIAAVGFGFFSMMCGLAWSLPMLIVFRVGQGLMGGPLMPMSQTLLVRVAPPHLRNMAVGLWAMTTILAPVAGPLLGGILSDGWGWPWAFYINVPISLVCGALAWRTLRGFDGALVRNGMDYVGLGLLIVWVGALQIMLDNGEDADWFASPFIVTMAIIAGLGFFSFLIWELTEKNPIVDLRVFRHRGFAVSAVAMFVTFGCFLSSIVLIPLWLQTNMGYTATASGELTAFNGVLGVLMAPVAALLISKMDARIILSFGVLVIGLDTLYRATFNTDITFGQLVPVQLALGFGMPLFFVPITSLSLASVNPEETASASGLVNFLRTMAGAFATAIITFAWHHSTTHDRVELSGALHNPGGTLDKLKGMGLTPSQALKSLDELVQSQSVMLATNHIFLIVGAILIVTAAGIWLMPKPSGPLSAEIGH